MATARGAFAFPTRRSAGLTARAKSQARPGTRGKPLIWSSWAGPAPRFVTDTARLAIGIAE